ncbi:MAG: alpha/beta hydrolase [Anaerolineae bacterium]
MALTEQVITVNNSHVRYYEEGKPFRRTLFFLHGGFGDAWLNWADLMTLMADDYHLIAVDLPGFGQSNAPSIMTLDDMVMWARDVMQALGIDEAVIVGHSFGGLIGRLLAAQHPRLATALVLVNGGVIPSVPGFVKSLARVPVVGSLLFNQISRSTGGKNTLKGAVKVDKILSDEFYSRVRANHSGLARLMRNLTLSPKPENRTPNVPVLMLWGEDDTITPVRSGETIKSNLPDVRMEVISDCGHFPHLEAPDVFIWQVRSFLEERV